MVFWHAIIHIYQYSLIRNMVDDLLCPNCGNTFKRTISMSPEISLGAGVKLATPSPKCDTLVNHD